MSVKHFFANNLHGVGHWTTERINAYRKPSDKWRVLNVASGNRKFKGSVSIDYDESTNPDKIWKSTEPLPFPDKCFDEVFCLNFLEHIFEFNEVLSEIYRVMKPGGILHVEVPYYNSFNFGQTPFHHIMFCETTMAQWYTQKGAIARYSDIKFEVIETELYFTKPAMLIPFPLRIKLAHYIPNLCYQIYWKLKKGD